VRASAASCSALHCTACSLSAAKPKKHRKSAALTASSSGADAAASSAFASRTGGWHGPTAASADQSTYGGPGSGSALAGHSAGAPSARFGTSAASSAAGGSGRYGSSWDLAGQQKNVVGARADVGLAFTGQSAYYGGSGSGSGGAGGYGTSGALGGQNISGCAGLYGASSAAAAAADGHATYAAASWAAAGSGSGATAATPLGRELGWFSSEITPHNVGVVLLPNASLLEGSYVRFQGRRDCRIVPAALQPACFAIAPPEVPGLQPRGVLSGWCDSSIVLYGMVFSPQDVHLGYVSVVWYYYRSMSSPTGVKRS
jgi:hypothetical protein